MWKYGIIVAILVILISVMSLLVVIAFTRKMSKIFDIDTRLAQKQTVFVFSLIMVIYLVPIIAMSILIFYDIFIALIIGILMVLLTIPVAYLIIIPLSDKKKIKYIEKMYGKDSELAKYLREKHKK